jgi:hypothetical protein
MDSCVGNKEQSPCNDTLLKRKRFPNRTSHRSAERTKTGQTGKRDLSKYKKKNKELRDINNDAMFREALEEGIDNLGDLRKSKRNKNVETEPEIIYCHQCKRIDLKERMFTCGNAFCRESYCKSCVRKNMVRVILICRYKS